MHFLIAEIYDMQHLQDKRFCLVLDLVSKYLPADNNEIFDIINLLEDRLQHANAAVVLATIKLFLHMTLSMNDVHQEVWTMVLPFLAVLWIEFFIW